MLAPDGYRALVGADERRDRTEVARSGPADADLTLSVVSPAPDVLCDGQSAGVQQTGADRGPIATAASPPRDDVGAYAERPLGVSAYCAFQAATVLSYGNPIGPTMPEKMDVKQGTLVLMILRTIDVLGPLHGYGIARRIEETSGNRLALNYGTLYPALVKLEQEGAIQAEWRQSETNRRAKFYALTPAGRKLLARETREWHETADLIAAFLAPKWEVQ